MEYVSENGDTYEVTATLKKVKWVDPVYMGDIYDDSRGRWPNGTPIWTSTVQEVVDSKLIVTLNSNYLIEEGTDE